MRDIPKYEKDYSGQPYEKVQAGFRKRNILASLSRYSHKRILEVGCGLEPFFVGFDDFETMTVVEPGAMFFAAAQKARDAHPKRDRIVVLNASFESSLETLIKERFDFIIVSSLLHEIPEPTKILEGVRALSDDETTTHVNVPNARSFHRILAVEAGLVKNEFEKSESQILFQQHHTFSQETLRALVEGCGFGVIEAGSYAVKPFTHAQMQQLIDLKIIGEDVLEGLYRMSSHLPELGSEIFVNIRRG